LAFSTSFFGIASSFLGKAAASIEVTFVLIEVARDLSKEVFDSYSIDPMYAPEQK